MDPIQDQSGQREKLTLAAIDPSKPCFSCTVFIGTQIKVSYSPLMFIQLSSFPRQCFQNDPHALCARVNHAHDHLSIHICCSSSPRFKILGVFRSLRGLSHCACEFTAILQRMHKGHQGVDKSARGRSGTCIGKQLRQCNPKALCPCLGCA